MRKNHSKVITGLALLTSPACDITTCMSREMNETTENSSESSMSAPLASSSLSSPSQSTSFPPSRIGLIILVGLAAGLLSGLFGVGGGTVMVPGLMLCGFSQRRSSATSLAAMPLASLGGIVSYSIAGNVHWAMGCFIIVGSISGALIGARLLHILPERILRWVFVFFIALIIIQQFTDTPSRASHVVLTPWTALGMIILGMVAGILAALLGVGGGAILVPGMSAVFGASDLVSRGTSLLAIMPGAVSGTVSNIKAGLVDIRAAAIIGVIALVTTPIGGIIASGLTPQINQWGFIAFLVVVLIKSVHSALKKRV
ncbi:sulfite exporter TauE/SafE family protein [Alloscardovia theropitheci]|uniref:Probable membrane transporter protein n=1 Tax=Alloscardovia theropitheci TaxID=2496842 RepID=A0A4R0QTG8_9BIFI|nr:sulfite exporter TauE/SafE family protein [Alloscardovia theropitheci]TCD54565.1 sulfite exporter TauE/SafE family protein [Alloscardovia theropitheci]